MKRTSGEGVSHEGFLDYLDSKIPDAIKKIRDEKDEETLIAQLKAENASLWALAKFGRWSLGFHLEGYHEKYSSYERDAAFDLGILEEVRVEKPCSSNCQCKFYDNIFPRNCVRETPLAQLPEKRE